MCAQRASRSPGTCSSGSCSAPSPAGAEPRCQTRAGGEERAMARTEIEVAAPPEAVWSVLADAGAYGEWVVGTKNVARADAEWPEPGSALEYELGIGPISVGDHTVVVEAEPPRRLILRAELQRL